MGATLIGGETLHTIGAVHAVGEWDPRQTHPVRLEGTVTLVNKDRRLVVLQDATGAIALKLDPGNVDVVPGHRIAVTAPDSWPYLESLLEFPHLPSGRELLTSFEAPSAWGYNYIARVRGYLHPPTTGEYQFWIASDDSSELWLSSGDDRPSLRRIARVGIWTKPREWSHLPTQQSAPVFLEAGRRYLIEAVHEQRGGTDHLSVSWAGPGFPRQIVDGAHLSSWPAPTLGNEMRATSVRGRILREFWTGNAVENASQLTTRRKLETELVLSQATLRDLGPAPLPAARTAQLGERLELQQNFLRSTLEGTVNFVARDGDTLALELGDGMSHARVVVKDWRTAPVQRINGRRVRVTGVAESVGIDGQQQLGTLWVSSPSDFVLVDQPPHGDRFQPTTILEIMSGNPALLRDQPVRLSGRVVDASVPGQITLSDDGVFYGYTSSDGVNWSQLGPPVEIPMGESVEAGMFVTSRSTDMAATAIFEQIGETSTEPAFAAIGGPLRFGEFNRQGSRYTLTGSGHDVWVSPDRFYFAHRPLVGAGEIVARVAEFNRAEPWAKAGIMIRESLSPDAPFVDLVQTGAHGCCLQWRKAAEGSAPRSAGDTSLTELRWLKLARRFNTLTVAIATEKMPRVGQRVEVLGYIMDSGNQLSIGDASFREYSPDSNPPLAARQSRPLVDIGRTRSTSGNNSLYDILKIRGVVTFIGEVAGRHYIAVQDQSGATFVSPNRLPQPLRARVGQFVEVQSSPGWALTSPDFGADNIFVLGPAALPKTLRHPAQYSLPRRGEASWVEVEGIVRSVSSGGLMQLKENNDLFTVAVSGATAEKLRRHIDARLRLRGAIAYPTEHEHLLLVPSEGQIEVIDSPPALPFSLPVRRLDSLAPEQLRHRSAHRIKVKGSVTFVDRGFVYLQDDSGGARVELAGGMAPKLDETVEAAGFPDLADDYSAILTHAVLRPTTGVAPPAPIPVTATDILSGRFGAKLVRLKAIFSRHRSTDSDHTLELQLDQRIFRASLSADVLPSIPSGSLIEVTGVCVFETALPEWIKVSAGTTSILPVRLLLRSPSDIAVLQKPRWWAVKRTLIGASVAIFVLAVSVIWIHTLRRRVAHRTAELRTAMEKLQRETQTAATLAERNRLAGEIHDSLEQGFSGLILQIDSTARLGSCPQEVRAGLGLARNMVAFSRDEVRHAVWDLQSPILENSDLGGALKKIVEQLAPETPHTTISVEGEVRPLGSAVEHHLLRIAQEAIANGVKHAAAQNLDVVLSYSAHEVSLSIRDDGRGFVPGKVLTGGVGHFGLRSLRGRAHKIQGTLKIVSEPGKGTVVEIRVATPSAAETG